MATALDMSLDDLIKQNKTSRGGARGGFRGRRGGRGGERSGGNGGARGGRGGGRTRDALRPAPYSFKPRRTTAVAVDMNQVWQHDMYEGGAPAAAGGSVGSIQTGTKLYISNLDHGVSQDDIKDLFSDVGDIKRSSLHFDKSGRSKGTAEVVFARKADALAAVKRYNNVLLDGKPMKIEIVGTNLPVPGGGRNGVVVVQAPAAQPIQLYQAGPTRRAAPAFARRGGSTGRGRGADRGRGGGRGRGRGRGGRSAPPSAEDLDKELESYHTANMES